MNAAVKTSIIDTRQCDAERKLGRRLCTILQARLRA